MRAVLDTNVIMSAVFFGGFGHECGSQTTQRERTILIVVVSPPAAIRFHIYYLPVVRGDNQNSPRFSERRAWKTGVDLAQRVQDRFLSQGTLYRLR